MAWYIKKYVNIGPVRLNLSKSGIGTSVGVKGFRIGIKSNGKSYIHAGRYGMFYRHEFNSTFSKEIIQEPIQKDDLDNCIDGNNTIYFKPIGTDILKSNYKKDVVDALTKSYNAFRFDYLIGIVTVLLTILLYFNIKTSYQIGENDISPNYTIPWIVLFSGLILFAIVANWETKRRRIDIIYEFENNDCSYYQDIICAFNQIAKCNKSWSLLSSQKLYNTYQSKINAGASDLTDIASASIGTGEIPWVNTNISSIPLIKTNSNSLFFVPDGILVYDNNGIAYVEYSNIEVDYDIVKFIDDNPPRDANIIDHTWKYANINGGPDRRFNNNKMIPVCAYGILKINANGKLLLYLMTSKEDAPEEFCKAMKKCQLATSK